jgi:hypothetical protein
LILAAIQASAPASALVGVALAGGSNGTGVVSALSATALVGGLNYLVVQNLVASAQLANTDAAFTIQKPTLVSTQKAIQIGNDILLTITGSTAGIDNKDFIAELQMC